MKNKQGTTHHGFTLIELLVVISIIALLIAILLPALKQARQAAQAVTCMSQQRQIAIAMTAYIVDNHGYYATTTGTKPTCISWDDRLSHYDGRNLTTALMNNKSLRPNDANGAGINKVNNLYLCPSEDYWNQRSRTGNAAQRTYQLINGSKSSGHYPYQDYLGFARSGIIMDGSINYQYDTATIDQVPSPSQTLLAAESRACSIPLGGRDGQPYSRNPAQQVATTPSASTPLLPPLHNGTWNYLFCDGHGERLKAEDTVGSKGTLSDPLGYWTRYPGD